jgi:hypothetical protein
MRFTLPGTFEISERSVEAVKHTYNNEHDVFVVYFFNGNTTVVDGPARRIFDEDWVEIDDIPEHVMTRLLTFCRERAAPRAPMVSTEDDDELVGGARKRRRSGAHTPKRKSAKRRARSAKPRSPKPRSPKRRSPKHKRS